VSAATFSTANVTQMRMRNVLAKLNTKHAAFELALLATS
jgi:hypothetical protein